MRHLFTLCVIGCGSLLADPVLTFNSSGALSGDNYNQTVGWEFDVLSTITVDGLGWFAEGAAGLPTSHEIGIWNSSGTLVASGTVASGTADPLDGLFRTVSITPVVLTPGVYIIGGQNFSTNTEQLAFGVSPETASSISFITGEFIDGGFAEPTTATGDSNCCWGPSFSVESGGVSLVPEPAWGGFVLAFGLAGMVFVRRRKSA